MTTNVTEAVGQYFFAVLEKLGLMGSDEAMLAAKAETGVSDEQIESADMGDVFSYMCGYPGIDANLQGFLVNQAEQYNNYGNVSQGGSSYSGGGGGYSGGGGGGGAAASNQQIVQQVTQNYNYQDITDNSIDILGPVNGDIDIDQDNDEVNILGDDNAVNTGPGDQNAVTGDGASGAQSNGSGDANSNSGDGAVGVGGNVAVNGPLNTGEFDGIQNSGTVENSATGDNNDILDAEGAHINGPLQAQNDGDVNNVSGNYLEEGAAASAGGDATGQSVDVNVLSDVNEEHGPGDQIEADLDFGRPSRDFEPQFESRPETLDLRRDDQPNGHGGDDYEHQGGDEQSNNDLLSNNFSPPVVVNVEGGDGDQDVQQEDLADA